MMLVLTIFLAVLGLAFWLGQDDGPENESFNPPGSNSADSEEQNKQLAVYVLELHRPLGSDEKTQLTEQVNWLDVLSGHKLLVRVTAEQKQALLGLPYVKTLSEYTPEQKISRILQDETSSPNGQVNGEENTDGGNTTNGNAPTQNTDRVVSLTLTLTGKEDKPTVVNLVKSLGGRVLDGVTGEGRYLRVEVPGDAVENLAASPRVVYAEEYAQPEFLNDRAKDIVGARPLAIPQFLTRQGLNGEGQTIGLADSGLDTGSYGNLHPDLESPPGRKPRVIMLKSWSGVKTPADTVGHGTHMAGTLVGSGAASDGKYTGMAPEASLYFQGIVDENDKPAPPLDLWELYNPAYQAGVRIHVNGWGKKNNTYDSAASQIDDFVREHPDFLAIFGAGNSGPREGSLTAEANSKNILTVGASISPRPAFENATGSTEEIADFSSRGPARDGRIKPELVAPGTSVISLASRLTSGNLPGRPDYTILQGTSMATAVTGGAAALLRQYYEQQTGFTEPSAALMKTTLINGARRLEEEPAASGFGLLDIGSTIMALENRLFEVVDDPKGLADGKSLTLEKEITHSDAPFKVTLGWTDPAASPGATSALVNDLNLEVIAPDGQKYLGNDFAQRGEPDTINNVEQVYIPNPELGVYQIVVTGQSVVEDASPKPGITQDFALVYGQLPVRETVTESDSGQVTLSNGERLTLSEDTVAAVDDRLHPVEEKLPAGAQIYLTGATNAPGQIYAVGRTWQAGGIKTLQEDDHKILVRINKEYREGGYVIDRQAQNVLAINNHPAEIDQIIPPGATMKAGINPFTQTIWRANITSQEITGVLTAVDQEKRRVRLLNNEEVYSLAEEASISFNDIIVDGDPADLPFGASTTAGMDKLLPGMPVYVTLGSDGKVYHLAVNRHLVLGRVTGVEPESQNITLSSGGRYHVLPGVQITRNRQPAEIREINPGELVMINLVPGTTEALSVTACSNVSYGRVIFAEKDYLYIMDNQVGFRNLRFPPQTQIYRWGMPAGNSILSPGQWVRVSLDHATEETLRVDVAESAGKITGILEEYIPTRGIKLTNGDIYQLSSATVITKNDLPVKIRDLVPGEPVTVAALYGPNGEQIAASLEADTREGVAPPELKVISTVPFEEFSLVTGKTTASRLYVRTLGNKLEEVELTETGEFYYQAQVEQTAGTGIQLVAVDGASGGVAGLNLGFPHRTKSFPDIDGHWAEIDIRNLVSRGMLSGYPDGLFRPDKAVTRVEFTTMLARLLGAGSAPADIPYRDAGKIPDWAKDAVSLAHSRGLTVGYDDNTFRPHTSITREEAAVLLVRAYGMLKTLPDSPVQTATFADWSNVSSWARQDVSIARELGLLGGQSDNRFAPGAYITRAETAAALNRLLIQVTDKDR